jgi:hypothetical protein
MHTICFTPGVVLVLLISTLIMSHMRASQATLGRPYSTVSKALAICVLSVLAIALYLGIH